MKTRIDEIRSRLAATTPGPWERGNSYLDALVMPESYGDGNCVLCKSGNNLIVHTQVIEVDSEDVIYHTHQDPEYAGDTEHVITGFTTRGMPVTICGNYDYEVGGVADPNYTEFIVNAPDDIAWMLNRIKELENNSNI